MINYIIAGGIVLIVALAARYIYKAKKSGKACIGCPDSGCCNGCCSCKKES